jgi:hypothetical protein
MNEAAKMMGDKLRRRMESQGIGIEELATMTGKQRDHVRAVLDGYPNTVKRPTQLDTVDEIARSSA